MTDTQEHDRESIAKVALLLALGGVLVPLLLSMLALILPGFHLTEDQAHLFLYVAVGFGLIAEIFAVVLGVAGWEHLYGKIAVGCAAGCAPVGGRRHRDVYARLARDADVAQIDVQAQPAGPGGR